MLKHAKDEAAIGVTAFKAECLGLIDDVVQGKRNRIILLKHNRPVAAVVPLSDAEDDNFDLWGAMRGTVTVAAGVDLTAPAGETWEAEK
ncbi:MAG TPA: hypothetical protein VG267_07935 [Terracidiphilus sp.]|jgi:prevent-host-death family protein|nr:hypothetical protein [Terracidiphilus sp.]